ncbi:hypothetical protein H4219_003151 [Mycoemilia scoparia]|uniref:rhizopuspepsin n=1 Tax=Mycoemilia scoparia TaxID=417184 RepID=A0A9W7ZVK3_9FUNG|nr:hypothetical protein H4219_003151 [Mycoemilia scoparia]
MVGRSRVLAKHRVSVSGRVRAVVQKLPVSEYGLDIEYYGEVGIGTPPQMFKLDLDTGSGDVWLPSRACAVCQSHRTFDVQRSQTFRNDGRHWRVSYGDGSYASGNTIIDTVTIGDLNVTNQVIGLANQESSVYQKDIVDGLLGLGYSGISSVPGTKSFVDNLFDQNLLQQPLFSVYLKKNGDSQYAGEYLFGAIDDTKYTGDIEWVPVTRQRFWEIRVSGGHFQSTDGSTTSMDIGGDAIIDTGTTLLVMSLPQARSLHRVIPDAHYDPLLGWVLPCNTASRISGSIEFNIGSKSFGIPVSDFVREPVKDLDDWCFSAVTSGEVPMMILGDIFIKNNYVIFDRGNNMVGIAPVRL